MGWSDPAPQGQPHDAQQIAKNLHALLDKAGATGPYVLVGWSFGGFYSRVYAQQYPDQVAGMVLLDSSYPEQWSSSAAGQAQYASATRVYSIAPVLVRLGLMRVMGHFQPATGLPAQEDKAMRAMFAATKDWDEQSAEFLAGPSTTAQVRASGTLSGKPLYVVSATNHGLDAEGEKLWQDWQLKLASLSTNSAHQIAVGASHASLWTEPKYAAASVEAILSVVQAARSGEPLKP